MTSRFWVVGYTLSFILFVIMVLVSVSESSGVVQIGWPTPFYTWGCVDAECITEMFYHSSLWIDVGVILFISFMAAFWYDQRRS